jgi:hypothetical protein
MSAGTPFDDRWIESVREIVRQEVAAQAPYAGVYDYVVTASNGSTCDAVPADTSRGLPPVTGIPILSGIPGAKVTPANGSRVGIGFLDCNPTKPFVWGLFDSRVATLVSFAGGTSPVARQGDTVIVFFPPAIPFTGTAIVGGVPSAITGVMTPAQPATGQIQIGNPVVQA